MISIIMPAYNEERNIEKAIQSIINQTYKEFELFIVNDGSTDKTATIVEKYASIDKRIKFINQKEKIGKVAAYNLASKEIKGDWVYFMGADDELLPNSLEIWNRTSRKLDCRKKIAIRGRMLVVSDNPKYNGLILPKNKKRMNFSGPLTLLSKGMHQFILPEPVQLPNEDNWWELCIRFFCDEQIAIDDIVVNYKIHNGNSIPRNSSFEKFSEKYHIRFNARELFLQRFYNELKKEEIEQLKNELLCEKYRYSGQTLKILSFHKISLFYKIRMLFFSKAFLYKIKIYFDRYFLGH